MRSLSDQFEMGKEFLRNIKLSDKVLVVYHKDVDGVCSAVLFLEAFKKLGIKPSVICGIIEEPEKILSEIVNFDKIIIVDVAIDHLHEKLKESGKDILFLDHHNPFTDMNNEKIVHINPHFEKDVYQPASYVSYKFLSDIVDIESRKWVAVLGVVGDYGFKDCMDLLEGYVDVKVDREMWDTDFGKAAIKLGGAILEAGSEKAIDVVFEASKLNDVVENKIVVESYEKYNEGFENSKKEFEKNMENFDEVNLIFSVIEPSYKRVGSAIATQFVTKNPSKVVMVLEKIDKGYKIHARYHEKKFDLGALVKKCTESIGLGGGHKGAAGGIVEPDKLEEFKKRVIEELKRIQSTF